MFVETQTQICKGVYLCRYKVEVHLCRYKVSARPKGLADLHCAEAQCWELKALQICIVLRLPLCGNAGKPKHNVVCKLYFSKIFPVFHFQSGALEVKHRFPSFHFFHVVEGRKSPRKGKTFEERCFC